MKESPGEVSYLNRLEDRWHHLWVKYRGTEFLPDANEDSATKFDLPLHIGFLRRHIDKNAL